MRGYVTASPAETPLVVNLRDVLLPAGEVLLEGDLAVPEQAEGFVVLSFDTLNDRRQTSALGLAASLQAVGLGTLRLDLLTKDEQQRSGPEQTAVPLHVLSQRLSAAARWLVEQAGPGDFPLALVGFQRSGAASLLAATALRQLVRAVVTESGHLGPPAPPLPGLDAPVLFVEGAPFSEQSGAQRAAELTRQWLHYHLLLRPLHAVVASHAPARTPAPN